MMLLCFLSFFVFFVVFSILVLVTLHHRKGAQGHIFHLDSTGVSHVFHVPLFVTMEFNNSTPTPSHHPRRPRRDSGRSQSSFSSSAFRLVCILPQISNWRIAPFLPPFTSFLPFYHPSTLFILSLPWFCPVLGGKMCRGEKGGKNGLNSFYPRVKAG